MLNVTLDANADLMMVERYTDDSVLYTVMYDEESLKRRESSENRELEKERESLIREGKW